MPKNTHTYSCTHTLTNNESIIRSLFLLLLAYTYIHIYVYACHVCRAASICSNLSAWACKLWNLPLHINIWPSKSINCKTKHTKFHMLDIEEILHLFWFLFFFLIYLWELLQLVATCWGWWRGGGGCGTVRPNCCGWYYNYCFACGGNQWKFTLHYTSTHTQTLT